VYKFPTEKTAILILLLPRLLTNPMALYIETGRHIYPGTERKKLGQTGG
jgi:hypothetical protein